MKKKKSKKMVKPKLGPKVGLISQRNRVMKDKKREDNKNRCRERLNPYDLESVGRLLRKLGVYKDD